MSFLVNPGVRHVESRHLSFTNEPISLLNFQYSTLVFNASLARTPYSCIVVPYGCMRGMLHKITSHDADGNRPHTLCDMCSFSIAAVQYNRNNLSITIASIKLSTNVREYVNKIARLGALAAHR